jgi:hypothetical protein
MRSLFDQYEQPENRLTHALLVALNEDRKLLERFVRWSVDARIDGRRAEVLEQALPGDPISLSDEEAERRGLPDGCIASADGWALLIESKFAAGVDPGQLQRHVRTAARRGLSDCSLLVLAVDGGGRQLPKGIVLRPWSEVYVWLRQQDSFWAKRCAEYIEIAEAKGVASNYLKAGTLTEFSGVPFDQDEPYSYLQAKRLLSLLREELLQVKALAKELDIDPQNPGRGAITGRQSTGVWDFIGFRVARKATSFTQHPHLTLGILAERAEVVLTVPNGVKASVRAALLGDSFEEFEARIATVTRGLERALRSAKGARPVIGVVQRHYASQRSQAVVDSLLVFDPRTALRGPRQTRGGPKVQPQWLQAAHSALASRRSNLQFQIGAYFPYSACPVVRSRQVVEVMADVWLACRPIIDVTTRG